MGKWCAVGRRWFFLMFESWKVDTFKRWHVGRLGMKSMDDGGTGDRGTGRGVGERVRGRVGEGKIGRMEDRNVRTWIEHDGL